MKDLKNGKGGKRRSASVFRCESCSKVSLIFVKSLGEEKKRCEEGGKGKKRERKRRTVARGSSRVLIYSSSSFFVLLRFVRSRVMAFVDLPTPFVLGQTSMAALASLAGEFKASVEQTSAGSGA